MFSATLKMSKSQSLEEIKVGVDLLCLDIENLQDGDKIAAVKHIEASVRILKLGSSLAFQLPSPAKRRRLDNAETQPRAVKTGPGASQRKFQRKFQNLYNGLVPVCDQCGDTFPTLASLDAHSKKNHQTNNVATEVEILKTEIRKETKENTRNSRTKKDERKLNSSKSTKKMVQRYQCDFCDKKFGKKDSLQRHTVCHTSKYECDRCKHRFSEERKLRKHLLNKENCQKYLVKNDEIADISYVESEKVEEKKSVVKTETVVEKNIVKETKGFKCVPCSVDFSKQYNLSRHQKRVHKLNLVEA